MHLHLLDIRANVLFRLYNYDFMSLHQLSFQIGSYCVSK